MFFVTRTVHSFCSCAFIAFLTIDFRTWHDGKCLFLSKPSKNSSRLYFAIMPNQSAAKYNVMVSRSMNSNRKVFELKLSSVVNCRFHRKKVSFHKSLPQVKTILVMIGTCEFLKVSEVPEYIYRYVYGLFLV